MIVDIAVDRPVKLLDIVEITRPVKDFLQCTDFLKVFVDLKARTKSKTDLFDTSNHLPIQAVKERASPLVPQRPTIKNSDLPVSSLTMVRVTLLSCLSWMKNSDILTPPHVSPKSCVI